MKAASVRWFLAGYIVLFLVLLAIDSSSVGIGIGVSLNYENGNYSFSGGAPPWLLAFATVNTVLYAAIFWSDAEISARPMPYLFRRFLAGMTDWLLAIFTLAPLLGLVAVLVEYKETGVFDWVIDRQEPRPMDTLLAFGGVLTFFAVMVVYTAVQVSNGKPTPGACVFGYRIVADERSRLTIGRAALRALLGTVALLGWPCWILAYALNRDEKRGKFWLDNVFKTHAEYL